MTKDIQKYKKQLEKAKKILEEIQVEFKDNKEVSILGLWYIVEKLEEFIFRCQHKIDRKIE